MMKQTKNPNRKLGLFLSLALVAMGAGFGLQKANDSAINKETAGVKTLAASGVGTYGAEARSGNTVDITPTGTVPTGSSAQFMATYGTLYQMTNGNHQLLDLSGYNNIKITQITLSMRSNKSSGSGKLEYSFNNTSWAEIIPASTFSSPNWNGAWSQTYVDVTKTVDITVSATGKLYLKITATANSIYCQSYTLSWEDAPPASPLSKLEYSGTITNSPQYAGKPFDPTGLTFTATREDTSQVDVTNLVTFSPATLSVGQETIVASYTEGLITKSVTVTGLNVIEYVPTLIISEVYGGGGNGGAYYKNDFVEIFNATTSPISLTGYSLQFTFATGGFTVNAPLSLDGTVAAKGYYLIELAEGANKDAAPLPGPDIVGTFSMGATSGKVALVNGTDAISNADDSNVVDFVGFGSADEYEGTGPTPAPSNTKSVTRIIDDITGEPVDTNDNALDFIATETITPKGTSLTFIEYFLEETLDSQYCTALNWTDLKNLYDQLSVNAKAYFATHAAAVARHNYLVGANSKLVAFDAALLPVGHPLLVNNDQMAITTFMVVLTGLSLIAGFYVFRRKARA
ncbi:MAG: lamin tail domain-containing protein [Bacilli bacterium]